MITPLHYALVGFANTGKSSLFNALTHGRQKVSNWAGATVAVKQKKIICDDLTNNTELLLSDLPGISSLFQKENQGQDVTISRQFILDNKIDCFVNVIDATQFQRQLTLTIQLKELGIPMIVLLNKTDRKEATDIDVKKLSQLLQCQVLCISAHNNADIIHIKNTFTKNISATEVPSVVTSEAVITETLVDNQLLRIKPSLTVMKKQNDKANAIVAEVIKHQPSTSTYSDKLDFFILHPLLGIPIFLGIMYCLFMFAINVGGAFIDFFDVLAGALFVSYPLHYMQVIGCPMWLLTIVEGVGSGMQTVATFIPIIASLFIGLSVLESSGYLARAAFVVDSFMQKIGLPGKAFVPLIVGFGCTVPAVMATRVLDSERERISTVMMSPFMSCGARLPVYALFAAAFFPDNGQNLVFLLYFIGILAAIFTGFLLKKTTLPGRSSVNILELPLYEIPKLPAIATRVWQRTSSFVTGAGKIIVIVVCLINFTNSIGTDGSFGHQGSEESVLSQTAKVILPILYPLGIKEDNWQAGVGIITGIFAKEVLVATFNNLYSPQKIEDEVAPSLFDSWEAAVVTIKANLLGINANDPLGMSVGEIDNLSVAAQEQDVELTTYQVMQSSFDGQLGAFSYLLFILLYTPCVAAMGAIKNEVGTRWAIFAGTWSLLLAYQIAVLSYQIGRITVNPIQSLLWIAMVLISFFMVYFWLKYKSKRILTIPVSVSYY